MAVTFLRYHAQPQYTPARRAKPADTLAGNPDLVVAHRQPLAGERGHELALAVASHTGDAEDLACRDGETHLCKASAMGGIRCQRQPGDLEPDLAAAGPGRAPRRRAELRSDHEMGEAVRGCTLRVTGRNHLASTHDRGAIAQRTDFLELVRDIQDRVPLMRELLQRREKPLGLLRR